MNRSDPRRLANYLQHILEAVDNIQDYTAGATLESYRADRKTQDAVACFGPRLPPCCESDASVPRALFS